MSPPSSKLLLITVNIICRENSGCSGAWTTLTSWLSDPQRALEGWLSPSSRWGKWQWGLPSSTYELLGNRERMMRAILNLKTSVKCNIQGVWSVQWRVLPRSLCTVWLQPPGIIGLNITCSKYHCPLPISVICYIFHGTVHFLPIKHCCFPAFLNLSLTTAQAVIGLNHKRLVCTVFLRRIRMYWYPQERKAREGNAPKKGKKKNRKKSKRTKIKFS